MKNCLSCTCRAKASRARHPAPADQGPLLIELIHRHKDHLEAWADGESTLQTFTRIARTLVPLNARFVASISQEEWRNWFESATAGMAPSTKALWRRQVRTLLVDTANWFSVAVSSITVPPTAPRPIMPSAQRLAALCTAPRTRRTRLVMKLLTAGFMPREIINMRVGPEGDVRLEHPAWGRRNVPRIPQDLQAKLSAFATSRGLPMKARVFPTTTAAIREVVKSACLRRGLKLTPTDIARAALE